MANLLTPSGRLTEAGVRFIRAMRAEKDDKGKPKHTYEAIAKRVGLTLGTIYNVCTGKTWQWLV